MRDELRMPCSFILVFAESLKDRKDLSHPIHSDNCVMQPDHTCLKQAPAYVQRDYRYSPPPYLTSPHLFLILDKNKERTDLSHPVHSDNCVMQPDNTCIKERPAYVERDFTWGQWLDVGLLHATLLHTVQSLSVVLGCKLAISIPGSQQITRPMCRTRAPLTMLFYMWLGKQY